MRPSNVQVNDVARLLEKFVNLVFVLLPSLLISFKLLVLVLSLLSKLGLLSADDLSLTLELPALSPEQVLESKHELFQECIDRRAFTRLEILYHALLLLQTHYLRAKMLLPAIANDTRIRHLSRISSSCSLV